MNRSIKNKMTQPRHSCIYCGKGYVKKSNLDNHLVLCDLLHNKSRKTLCEDDELIIPSSKNMYKMILELSKKINILDEKVEEVNKWVVKKKKKINVIVWLNLNVKPEITFENLYNKINITEEDINYLFENSVINTLQNIFSKTIYSSPSEQVEPIFAFIQKSNIFYIYENEDVGWTELKKEVLNKFLEKVYAKFVKYFINWKKNNSEKIKSDEKLENLCDKTSVKVYSLDLKNDSTFSKIRSNMYSSLKTDMKALIEYEFEF